MKHITSYNNSTTTKSTPQTLNSHIHHSKTVNLYYWTVKKHTNTDIRHYIL